MRLATPRLTLRRWRPDDAIALSRIDGDPEVMRYIGDGTTRTPAQTAESIARMERAWDEFGYGLFAAEVIDSGELAGWVGLAVPTLLPEVLPAVEIGWRLGRAYWGQGYATEAARAVLRFAFDDAGPDHAGLDRVVCIGHVDNTASANVMRKLGLRLDGLTTVPSNGRSVQVMALDRADYRADPARSV